MCLSESMDHEDDDPSESTGQQQQPRRPSAALIYERVRQAGGEELERPPAALAFSGLFAGFTVGATPLLFALALATVEGGSETFVAALVYPAGFIAVILGRAQLFTENTLYPVVSSFEDRRAIPGTARLWAIVFTANMVGAALFVLLAIKTSALPEAVDREMRDLGGKAADAGFGRVFWSAILAGWLLALVAWLVEAAETAIGQFFSIWLLTIPIALGDFSHCVATTHEVFAALFEGGVGLDSALGWLGTATLGNVVGGVLIVTLINYGQVRPHAPPG